MESDNSQFNALPEDRSQIHYATEASALPTHMGYEFTRVTEDERIKAENMMRDMGVIK